MWGCGSDPLATHGRTMRLLHTSDWHLGHTLHDLPRELEHARFLAWLLDTLETEAIDALVVTGDIFDTANPPAAAQRAYYEFLAALRARMPALEVVIIGGNHDSAARLDAPRPLLAAQRIHVVGGLPRLAGGALDLERMIVPLRDAAGEVAAVVAAVPFLRPADLPRVGDGPTGDPLIEGVRAVYAEVMAAARARAPQVPLIVTGHCYMVGTALSQLSERRILGGHQHALPADIFADDVSYAALGHLHKAQRVGREHVRYAGSPIPLATSEARYRHQVLVVELAGTGPAEIRSIEVPRAIDIVRVPASGAASLPEVRAALAELPRGNGRDPLLRPYLEVEVRLERPEPRLRQLIEEALEGAWPRLVKLAVCYTGDGQGLGERFVGRELKELDPVEVFERRYRRSHQGEPPPRLLEAFYEMLVVAQDEEQVCG